MPKDARDWHREKCPNCGNAIYPNQRHCSFCGCELPPLPAPRGTLDWRKKQEPEEPGNKAELEEQKNKREPFPLQRCSLCGQKSLFWDEHNKTYECLNPDCQATGKTPDTLFSWKLATEQEHAEQSAKNMKEREGAEREQTQPPRKQTSSGRAWWGNEYYDTKSKRWKTPTKKVSIRKFFLVLFTLACLVGAVWIGYLLFTHRTDAVVGIIILLADIGVLIWNVLVLRSYRWRSPSFGKILAVFLVSALALCSVCAYAEVEPFSDAKDKVIGYIPASIKDKVLGYFPASISEAGRTVWVEDITVGPRVTVFFLPTDLSLRLVTVNLRASDAAFGQYSRLGCRVELWSGSYYYGYYNVIISSEDVSHLKRSGVDLLFPIPADEPVFQSGGKFSTKVSSNPKWADLPCGLFENPYKDFVK